MAKKPLGCLTSSGLIATVLTLAAVTMAALASGNSIFSPGSLSAQSSGTPIGGVNSHAELAETCDACHAPFWGDERMQDRCLTCHEPIAQEMSQPESLHGSFGETIECEACHGEHRGPAGPLTAYEGLTYAHEGVGFSLLAHLPVLGSSPFDCRICHAESVREFDAAKCRSCHLEQDAYYLVEHIETFGPGCLNCHDGVDRYGKGVFDHQAMRFILEGAHQDLACKACHTNAHTIETLQKTLQGCLSCHAEADVHAGRLGPLCGECHTPAGWDQATIDHALTGYTLIGAHLEAECEGCHVDRQWTGLPENCFGCHAEQDDHQGRYGQQCDACHQPTTWSDVTFDHALSRFPLTGAHVQAACESCHKDAIFSGLNTFCAACHADPPYHAGLFSATCDSCHNTSRWRPTPYNGPHSFPYNHGGAGSTCATCHPNALTGYSCFQCHEHNQAEINKKHREEGIGDFSNCLRCHPNGEEEEGDDD